MYNKLTNNIFRPTNSENIYINKNPGITKPYLNEHLKMVRHYTFFTCPRIFGSHVLKASVVEGRSINTLDQHSINIYCNICIVTSACINSVSSKYSVSVNVSIILVL